MKVLKRNNSMVEFDLQKIITAMRKSFIACDKTYMESILEWMAIKTTVRFQNKVKNDMISVEDVQNTVVRVLQDCGYADVAKIYNLYCEQHEKV